MPQPRSGFRAGLATLRATLAGWSGPREDAYRQASLPVDIRQARFVVAITTPGILLANFMDLWLSAFGPEAVGRLWLFGWQGTLTLIVALVLARVKTPRALDILLLVWLTSYITVVLVFRAQGVSVATSGVIVLLAFGSYTLLPQRLLFRVVPSILLTLGDVWILVVVHDAGSAVVLPAVLAYGFVHLPAGWVAVQHERDRRHRYRAQLGEAAARRDLEHLANTDALTGALSRRRWLELAEAELERYRRQHRPFAVLMADLDRFKAVNDRYGHQVGDIVLQHFARLLQSEQRRLDVVGRLGGEEFVVLLPETDLAGASEVAERVVTACRHVMVDTTAGPVRITCSIGVAVIRDADAIADLLHRSDLAMLAAKEAGRDQVAVAAGGTPGSSPPRPGGSRT
ncbi:MAG: GGDEF domain-containing protein [Gemmatimonadales bacterium]